MCNIRLQADWRFYNKVESATFHIGFPVVRTDGQAVGRTYGHVTTKMFWMDR